MARGHGSVFNHIYYPAVNTYFDAGSTQTQDPTCCVLYWDDGDGTEAFTPLCRNPWRIHAGFWTETPAGPAKFADAYSDPTTVTCPSLSRGRRGLHTPFRGGPPPSGGDPEWPPTAMPGPPASAD